MFGLMDSAGAGIRVEKYRSKQSASRSLKSRTSDRKKQAFRPEKKTWRYTSVTFGYGNLANELET